MSGALLLRHGFLFIVEDILQKKGKETTYSIRAIPVGGFVSMAGETDGDEVYPDVIVPKGRRLTDQKPWKKIIIMLAGVLMNFVLAWIIFSLITLSNNSSLLLNSFNL